MSKPRTSRSAKNAFSCLKAGLVVTLNFPDKALVRTTITPDVHIFADVAKIIDGTNKIKLTDNNMGGMGAMIMSGANLPLVTANLSNMFSVDHVHND